MAARPPLIRPAAPADAAAFSALVRAGGRHRPWARDGARSQGEEGSSRVFFRRPARTEGERWTRAELARLRAGRFAPGAVGRFLVASQRRANEVRRARPALGRQARGWTGAGAAAWIGLGAAGVEPFRSRRAAGLAWWAACAVMLDWHLGMVETPAGAARPLSGADAVTLARAWLVPVVWDDPQPLALVAGALSDGVDGVLARRGEPTRIGGDLEGLVDACFAVAALAGARRSGRLGAAAARAEVGRLSVGFGYSLWAYFARLAPPDPRWARTARALTPVRAGGLVAAGLGLRRTADALVLGGAAASVGVLAAEWRERGGAP